MREGRLKDNGCQGKVNHVIRLKPFSLLRSFPHVGSVQGNETSFLEVVRDMLVNAIREKRAPTSFNIYINLFIFLLLKNIYI